MAQVESENRATSDPEARKRVLQEIKKTGVEDMLLWFTDLEGHLKSFSITVGEVEGALDKVYRRSITLVNPCEQ